ncbi:hypothetical protein COX08_02860 [Candidatus Beckwithbacteria bacterium CG23_combo_of_CG06-09_8_20_14_all_34_8]|uniref:Uncharacterized protein n=1 Tax=Candidatus Beckwithbacteria bacterium CG23_combo_of_CG06-09_8_20_14_all_34_8 TaxID=1974497 RepID=A0A2H0B624_9BACT|nr:MAG: hypothetical protein COX08_02860 [Candidatus Beckwithbacteria bacterium CG23_combo_of_CG06-09_8_20_14_all_34_8]
MSMKTYIKQQTIKTYRHFVDSLMHKVYDRNTKGRIFIYNKVKRLRKALDTQNIVDNSNKNLKNIEKMMRSLL